jgi:hypothetical protein
MNDVTNVTINETSFHEYTVRMKTSSKVKALGLARCRHSIYDAGVALPMPILMIVPMSKVTSHELAINRIVGIKIALGGSNFRLCSTHSVCHHFSPVTQDWTCSSLHTHIKVCSISRTLPETAYLTRNLLLLPFLKKVINLDIADQYQHNLLTQFFLTRSAYRRFYKYMWYRPTSKFVSVNLRLRRYILTQTTMCAPYYEQILATVLLNVSLSVCGYAAMSRFRTLPIINLPRPASTMTIGSDEGTPLTG